MERRKVKARELTRRINVEIANLREFEDVEFLGVQWHVPNEAGGVNWSVDATMFKGDSGQVSRCLGALQPIITEMQTRYEYEFDPD